MAETAHEVYEQTVTINDTARRRAADSEDEDFRAKITGGDFSRRVSLPGRVETEKSRAKHTNGSRSTSPVSEPI
jgi:HSP20 family molecular chaperone IbpA